MADLAYTQRILDWQKQRPQQLYYQPVVSRESGEHALRGRIPALIENGLLQAQAQCEFALATSQVLLCGNPAMIKDSMSVLETLGLKKHRRREPGQISLEKYW